MYMYVAQLSVAIFQGLIWTKSGQLHLTNHIIMSPLVRDSLTLGNYVSVIGTSRVDKWLHWKDGLILHYGGNGADPSKPRCVAAVQQQTQKSEWNVSLRPCNASDSFQHWTFGTYTPNYESLVEFPQEMQNAFNKFWSGTVTFP